MTNSAFASSTSAPTNDMSFTMSTSDSSSNSNHIQLQNIINQQLKAHQQHHDDHDNHDDHDVSSSTNHMQHARNCQTYHVLSAFDPYEFASSSSVSSAADHHHQQSYPQRASQQSGECFSKHPCCIFILTFLKEVHTFLGKFL